MATSRKTTSKDSARKATAAGPKRRAGSKRAAEVMDPPPEVGTSAAPGAHHLRTVDIAPSDGASTSEDATGSDTRFKRADLIEAVAARTSMKRADAKVVLDLVLKELGRALDHNEDLVLPPLGKLSVKRRKPDADGPDILTLKLRRPGPTASKGGETPLADPDEDG